MNMKYLTIILGSLSLLLLPSCVVPADYYGAPSAHSSIRVLPAGYKTVYVSGSPYYYHNNYWYKPYNGRYIQSSRPRNYYGPIGRSSYNYNHQGLHRLPSGYTSTYISGSRYYHNGNSWYQRRGNQYYKTSRPKHSPVIHKTPNNNYRKVGAYNHNHKTVQSKSLKHNQTIKNTNSYNHNKKAVKHQPRTNKQVVKNTNNTRKKPSSSSSNTTSNKKKLTRFSSNEEIQNKIRSLKNR